jgi:6-phosphogluconolactonase
MAPELVVVDPADFGRTVALRIARVLEDAVRERGTASLALPGGPQVKLCYASLAELQLPWSRVDFYFADERGVPTRHPAAAYFPAEDELFRSPRIGTDNVYRIEAERADHARVAEEYEARLPQRFDLLVLEVGLEGQVAGLFPGSPALSERERRVVAVEAPSRPRRRITITPREIESARALIVLATGRERAPLVARALRERGDASELPARLAAHGVWIVDRAAASRLG